MSEGLVMKKSEVADVKMSVGVVLDCAIGGVSDDQSGGGLDANAAELSPLEAVGHLYAMDGTIKQMSFVTDKRHVTNIIPIWTSIWTIFAQS